ncbi:MAG TPA: DUF87 domain-containing protein [Symbiobacteriaceae bacterium]|nr:DUF87 domain-containing protein [Symbiobacteriaceae bacterium]
MSAEIEALSAKRTTNVSVSDNYLKNTWKGVVGGENQSHQKEDAGADVEYQRAKQHCLALESGFAHTCRWTVSIGAAEARTASDMAARVRAFSEESGVPTRHRLVSDAEAPEAPACVTAREAAVLAALPFQAVTGLMYRTPVAFGTEPAREQPAAGIMLGYLDVGRPTTVPLKLDPAFLTGHALVTGVTGSGKTTTIKHILQECEKRRIPWLAVEPAKSEYRALPGVRVYRPGLYDTAPLRMTPSPSSPGSRCRHTWTS